MKKIKIPPATMISILLTVPYFVGILWTTLHPILSVITGELKCRGQYIDENGLDVHRHRVETYPLKRRSDVLLTTASNSNSYQSEARGEMCHAIHSLQSSSIISPSIECLHHASTETIEFDVVRIVPPLGPMIEATESIVLVIGGEGNDSSNSGDDWYKRSDLNASIMHLISKLGNKDDCPWLTKVVYIVSPTSAAMKMSEGIDTNATMSNERSSSYLTTVVDAFISSYLGDGTINNNARALPPEFTFPIIRSVLVINDTTDSINKATTKAGTQLRILPQGMSGSLPNLDLVFATYLSLQSHPAKKTSQQQRSVQSIFYGDKSKIMMHPFESDDIEKAVGRIMKRVCDMFGIQRSAVVEQYAKDLAGLFGFVAGLVIGPQQPHSSALSHGIDSLTIQVNIPNNKQGENVSIHPHYADLTRCVEHLLRSISNLHERLHHSIAQYIMPSPSKFVSHGEYIFPAILVSLPMVVRAATLALKDLRRFQFRYVGMVTASVCVATFAITLWEIGINIKAKQAEWMTQVLYAISYIFVVMVSRQNNVTEGADDKNLSNERRGSLRFVVCLVGVYFHAPLLLANYSLGFPSSIFWSPLLAMMVLPHRFVPRSKVILSSFVAMKFLFLLVTSPPIILVPRIFEHYNSYALGVYTPLHFLLTALWFA